MVINPLEVSKGGQANRETQATTSALFDRPCNVIDTCAATASTGTESGCSPKEVTGSPTVLCLLPPTTVALCLHHAKERVCAKQYNTTSTYDVSDWLITSFRDASITIVKAKTLPIRITKSITYTITTSKPIQSVPTTRHPASGDTNIDPPSPLDFLSPLTLDAEGELEPEPHNMGSVICFEFLLDHCSLLSH